MGRAAVAIDVEPIRLVGQRHHLGTQLVEHVGRDVIRRAVGAIDHQLEPAQVEIGRKAALAKLDIAPGCIGHTKGTAELSCRATGDRLVQPRLDARLEVVLGTDVPYVGFAAVSAESGVAAFRARRARLPAGMNAIVLFPPGSPDVHLALALEAGACAVVRS